jgi:hypothetical protein
VTAADSNRSRLVCSRARRPARPTDSTRIARADRGTRNRGELVFPDPRTRLGRSGPPAIFAPLHALPAQSVAGRDPTDLTHPTAGRRAGGPGGGGGGNAMAPGVANVAIGAGGSITSVPSIPIMSVQGATAERSITTPPSDQVQPPSRRVRAAASRTDPRDQGAVPVGPEAVGHAGRTTRPKFARTGREAMSSRAMTKRSQPDSGPQQAPSGRLEPSTDGGREARSRSSGPPGRDPDRRGPTRGHATAVPQHPGPPSHAHMRPLPGSVPCDSGWAHPTR